MKDEEKEKLLARARFEVRRNAQSIDAIEGALRAMVPIIAGLDHRVRAEEAHTRITDPKRVGYSTVARAARIRSSNLKKSVAELEARLVAATADHENAGARLAALGEREAARFIQLPLSDRPTGHGQRRGYRAGVLPLRAVTVIAPSNDNLANASSSVLIRPVLFRRTTPM